MIKDFPAVSNTALMTVYCRAMDFMAKNSILKDKFAYELYQRIDCDWKTIRKGMHKHDFVLTAIRGRKFDKMCMQFLSENPSGIVVSLGAGLDYRLGRIDNGKCTMVDIDFPEVSLFKKQIQPESSRCFLIGQSVLDFSWISHIQEIRKASRLPVFFIAEGLTPYLEKSETKKMFQNICRCFPQSEIFFDVCGEKTLKMMAKHSGIQNWNVELKSGFKSGHDFEEWEIGFKLLKEWYYPEDPDARKGMMKLMWIIPIFKSVLFFIHGKFEN